MIKYINLYWGQFYIFDHLNHDNIEWEWDFLISCENTHTIIYFDPEKEF